MIPDVNNERITDKPSGFVDRIIRFSLENRLVVILLLITVIFAGISVAPFDWESDILPRSPVAVDALPNLGTVALVAEVPHSRPVPVVGTVTDPSLETGLGLPPSTYQGPTGVVGVLSAACREAGLPAASLWAAVPTYVPTAPSPKAVLALLEHTAEVLGTWMPTTDLEIASAAYERQVTELVEEDDETSDYVTQLEERHDAGGDEEGAARSLVEEVERFLRDRPD